jgi:predicted RND superfamily exporter protein
MRADTSIAPTSAAGLLDRWVRALTAHAVRAPWRFLAGAGLVLLLSWSYASQLFSNIRGDFVELLPTDSETAQRFRSTLNRKGGSGSTVLVMIQSPDPEANRRAIDALQAGLQRLPPGLAASVESGPQQARAFYQKWRWLFAATRDLAIIECELDRARARLVPGYLDLDDPCDQVVDEEFAGKGQAPATSAKPVDAEAKAGSRQRETAPAPANAAAAGSDRADPSEPPLQRFEREMQARISKLDRFPTGYFCTPDGSLYALVVRSFGAGMGEYRSDELFERVQQVAAEVNPQRFHPELQLGYAGDIPNAVAERDALTNDILLVSALASALLLSSIVIFFRSVLSLWHIGLCVATGCGLAFSAAMAAYGHLNAATGFLGAIIAGNGINHGIVYLARYRERRGAGDSTEAALIEAATTCRKGTWLAALAASGSFGSLLLTSFRGFSEFGLIGGVGMVTCWLATFAILPASVVALERIGRGLGPSQLSRAPQPFKAPVAGGIATLGRRFPVVILVGAAVLCVTAAYPLPRYLSDPWEYNFARLKSKSSKQHGAGKWSTKSNQLFGSRGAPYLMLADDESQVRAISQALLERDQAVSGGRFIQRIETVYDRLGGWPEEVDQKLVLLKRIRAHLDRAMPRLEGKELRLARQWRPPDWLRPLRPNDLPELLLERFRERDGRVGTPLYVYVRRGVSQSRGENLLKITNILESVRLPDDQVVPNASRATVFAAMIRSMERDGPRATLAAFLVVIAVTLCVTRRLLPASAVIGALLCGVLYTVGGAAWINTRLNFLNFVAIPLIFGICVEYAINLYERMRAAGGDIAAGIRSAGGPVFLCSLTTILGYGSLLVADNQALQSFGRYAIAGEISCILSALLVMPAALHVRHRRRAQQGTRG